MLLIIHYFSMSIRVEKYSLFGATDMLIWVPNAVINFVLIILTVNVI